MELEGEEVYTAWAYADGDYFYSESWSIDMPASDAFVKTSPCDVVGLQKEAALDIYFQTIVTAEPRHKAIKPADRGRYISGQTVGQAILVF
jgi:hypothetical protein